MECQESRKGLTRLPADTPRTPGPKGVKFQQFCDRLRTDLPGDSHGRGSFDTSARFVAGDPGARFGDSGPLEYEVTGEIGHPHWELIFEYILRQCGYLVDFHTVYIMVDNRELANHKRRDPSLPHWPAAARWWHSRLKLIGPHKEKRNYSAGMTAHTVILVQTRVGFLTGGRGKKSFLALQEQMVQLEQAYARATVAIMMRQSVLALVRARVGRVHFYLHDHELSRSPPDESFIGLLKQNCCLSGPRQQLWKSYRLFKRFHAVRKLRSWEDV